MTNCVNICEYCHVDEDGVIRLLPRKSKGKSIAAVYPNGHDSRLLVTGLFKTQISIPISYCPICGRKLEDSDE